MHLHLTIGSLAIEICIELVSKTIDAFNTLDITKWHANSNKDIWTLTKSKNQIKEITHYVKTWAR